MRAQLTVIANVDQQSALVECKLLELEVSELREALESERKHLVLDEVVNVIYRARAIASAFGLTESVLDEYATMKGAIRSRIGKSKAMELYIARGVTAARDDEA